MVKKEIYEISMIDDKKYMRYMEPFLTEESCLKCHGFQGYKVGDVRGGITIAIPMDRYYENLNESLKYIAIVYMLLLIIGYVAIYLIFYK